MQVNHTTDHITHAVIGAQKSRAFAYDSESSNLAIILSDSLYSDKPLAVARETMCNAWDSHIQAGKTDVPIQITLDDEFLIIRDFGVGISDEQMLPIYGTYGKSTKKNDGKQTGGFGLGSKSPFAWADNFEVTSFHAGRKTIYAISKSSAEVGGQPSITPVVSVPTQETGLEVKVPLRGAHDQSIFRPVIEKIARFGEMNVLLNGEQLETLPFSQAVNGFILLNNNSLGSQGLFVRYGNVIYPIPRHENFQGQLSKIVEILNSCFRSSDRWGITRPWSLILQADPHSISVTPSRESLSMTDRTIGTLKGLLEKFAAGADQAREQTCLRIMEEGLQTIGLTGTPAQLFSTERKVLNVRGEHLNQQGYLTEFPEIFQTYLFYHYPTFKGFRQKEISSRIDAITQWGIGDKGKIQSFRKELLQEIKSGKEDKSDWLHKNIFAPLIKKMDQAENVPSSRLMVYEDYGRGTFHPDYGNATFTNVKDFGKNYLANYLPFLRNIVILSYNRTDVVKRVNDFPILKHWLGKASPSLLYIVPRTVAKVEAARAFFQKQGITIIDLTVAHKWETPDVITVQPKAVSQPRVKKVGLVRLDSFLNEAQNGIDSEAGRSPDAARVEDPKYVVRYSGAAEPVSGCLAFMDIKTIVRIAKALGSEIGCAFTTPQYEKLIEEGAKPLLPYLFAWLKDNLETNQVLRHEVGIQKCRNQRNEWHWTKVDKAIHAVIDSPELRSEFGVPPRPKIDVLRIKHIFDYLNSKPHWKSNLEFKAVKIVFDSIPQSQPILDLREKMEKSSLLRFVKVTEIANVLGSPMSSRELKDEARSLLSLAL